MQNFSLFVLNFYRICTHILADVSLQSDQEKRRQTSDGRSPVLIDIVQYVIIARQNIFQLYFRQSALTLKSSHVTMRRDVHF